MPEILDLPFAATCRAIAPALVCQPGDLLLYLAPSVALAVLIRMLAAAHPFFFVFTLAGTICHELSHYIAGLLSGARPGTLTVVPKRVGRHWELGSVTLNRVRWYNAAPAALAPLSLLLIPVAVAWWRTSPGWRFMPADLLLAFALAPQFLSFWPSGTDWRIAARSWPFACVIAALGWAVWKFYLP